jgi:hypothetical protein
MVAMHGREDPLLDAGRFPRLLRQANDAEVADVRKIGDDEYEVSPHRTGALPPITAPLAPASATQPGASEEAELAEAAAGPGSRENGQRLGLRFRRGSRAPLRGGEIPLIGVVEVETPAPAEPAAVAVAEDEPAAEAAPPKKRTRTRAPRKKAAAPATSAGSGDGEPDAAEGSAPRRTRSRPRAKKKAE